jgi:hypothetical protein
MSIFNGIKNYLDTTGTPILFNSVMSFALRSYVKGIPSLLVGNNSETNETFAYLCDRIITAFPQNQESMEFMIMDEKEHQVFDDVTGYQYFCGVVDLTLGTLANASAGSSGFAFDNRDDQNFICQADDPGITTLQRFLPFGPASYQFASGDTTLTFEQASEQVLAEIANIPSDLIQAASLIVASGHSTIERGFRPHFPNSLLTATNPKNAYTLLNNLQGYRNTYYTGQLVTTSGSFAVWNQAIQMVREFFCPPHSTIPLCTYEQNY